MKRLYIALQGEGRCRCCSSCLWREREKWKSAWTSRQCMRELKVWIRDWFQNSMQPPYQPPTLQGTLSQDRRDRLAAESHRMEPRTVTVQSTRAQCSPFKARDRRGGSHTQSKFVLKGQAPIWRNQINQTKGWRTQERAMNGSEALILDQPRGRAKKSMASRQGQEKVHLGTAGFWKPLFAPWWQNQKCDDVASRIPL